MKSEKFWDKMANRYDLEEKKDEKTTLQIIEKTKKYLKIKDIVLDFGCGTGLIANELADHVQVIHAIDTSSKMIEIAKKKAEGRNIKNIEFAHTTLFDERYQSGSLDAVLVFYILHLLEEPQKVIQRIDELLKPGGLIVSATPCVGEKIFPGILLSLVSKVGLIPKIRSYKFAELEDLFVNGNFEIVETECLVKNSQQNIIIAKKIENRSINHFLPRKDQ